MVIHRLAEPSSKIGRVNVNDVIVIRRGWQVGKLGIQNVELY